MMIESYLPADQVPSCVDHGPYAEMSMDVLASLAVAGDDAAYAEVSRRVATGARADDFHYELRHPGHSDQSVHNPHKGGGAPYEAGAWKTVSPAERTAMDVAVMDNLNAYNSVHGDEVKAFAVKSAYLKERVQGDTYVNGNVVVRFPEGTPKDVQKKVLADVDTGMTHAPAAMVADKNYPIEINVGRSTVVNGETMNGLHKGDLTAEGKGGSWIGLNQDHMAQRGAVRSELKPTNGSNSGSIYPADVPFHPSVAVGKDSASFTVVHEIGHSVAAYSGTRQGGFGDKGVFYNTNRGQLGYISSYASKNTNERYAEHFAAFVFGATDQVTTEIAGVDKWRKP